MIFKLQFPKAYIGIAMEVEVGAQIAIHMLTNPIVSHSFLWIDYC